jgi:hypothetical protein
VVVVVVLVVGAAVVVVFCGSRRRVVWVAASWLDRPDVAFASMPIVVSGDATVVGR